MKILLLLVSSFTSSAAVTYSYVGCYTDRRHEWVFFWWATGVMNAAQCAGSCVAQKFRYFGMAGGTGRDCHCGNLGYDKYGAGGGCSNCNYLGQSYTCGAHGGSDWRIVAVYRITSQEAVNITIDDRFIGCWSASSPPYMVGSPAQVGSGTTQTVDECAKACKLASAAYSGIMNGGTACYCGSDLRWQGDNRNPGGTSACSSLCTDGNPCGGGGTIISLYRAVCKPKEYGMTCQPCHCQDDVSCDVTTGVCPASCASGWLTAVSNGPCSMAEYPLGLYVSHGPCDSAHSWQQNANLAPLRDGATSTCIDTSTVSNETWRIWWKLKQQTRSQEVTITYKDEAKCSGMNMPYVSIHEATCRLGKSCSDKRMLYPSVMNADGCPYRLVGNVAFFSDSVHIEIHSSLTMCEIEIV